MGVFINFHSVIEQGYAKMILYGTVFGVSPWIQWTYMKNSLSIVCVCSCTHTYVCFFPDKVAFPFVAFLRFSVSKGWISSLDALLESPKGECSSSN